MGLSLIMSDRLWGRTIRTPNDRRSIRQKALMSESWHAIISRYTTTPSIVVPICVCDMQQLISLLHI